MGLDIVNFFENKTPSHRRDGISRESCFGVLVFVEKILRIQPNINRLFLLVRAADCNMAANRLNTEIFKTRLCRVLGEKEGDKYSDFIAKKVTPVAGDVALEDLGVQNSELLREIQQTVEIIIHLAASTGFIERYDMALAINAFGVYHLANFAKTCPRLKSWVHISTNYVCGEMDGTILERLFGRGETLDGSRALDIDLEKKIVDQKLKELRAKDASDKETRSVLRELGLQRARMHGWPNTYVFTKAMGEMVLEQFYDHLPIVIVRSPMISSTFKEPFPGWIENLRNIDRMAISFGKGELTFCLSDPDTIIDMYPVDMFVNVMILVTVIHSHKLCNEKVYQVGSSSTNPLSVRDMFEFVRRYFVEKPRINDKGSEIKISSCRLLPSLDAFHWFLAIRYVPFQKALHAVNSISNFQTLHELSASLDRMISVNNRLAQLYKPYFLFKGIFDCTKLEALRGIAEENEVNMDGFETDPRCFNWEEYLTQVHFPGVMQASTLD